MIAISPLTAKKIKRFRSVRRGYWSLVIFCCLILLSLAAELLINNRAIAVYYNGHLYLPTYGDIIPGTTFGFDYRHETDYRDLAKRIRQHTAGNWILMPPVPYNPYENDFSQDGYPPTKPSLTDRHFLGTDTAGRDVLARLVYGFRIAVFFSLALLTVNYVIGVAIGSAMGYWGGKFDLFLQRVIEVWHNIPLLYVIIIVSSIMVPNFTMLLGIMVFFGWISLTWIMRTVTYKEKERDYTLAARSLGASDSRIIFSHILPNTVSIIVTFAPFSVAEGIIALTSLDYLGFGLAPPTPSWGELLQQGWANMQAWWIAGSVVIAMIWTLAMVTFTGEAVREAFDPKMHTVYE
ncbi:MAG: ABC transporter permease subunit [Thermodesulfobacteriota bacterium]|nr:ABC transporter permease subunit [Thermodesulfobacteriota bacterium]